MGNIVKEGTNNIRCRWHAWLKSLKMPPHTGETCLRQQSRVTRAVPRRDNWGVYIHIFMFTYRKNNRFQKKSVEQNTISICTPPSRYGPASDAAQLS